MQIIDNPIITRQAPPFLTGFPDEYEVFLKGKWDAQPKWLRKEQREKLRAGRRSERHERRGKLRMLLYERIKCWEMTKGKMLKTGMINIIEGPALFAVEEDYKCHLCGAAGEVNECHDCGEHTCENCTATYNQFSQIDYTLCKRCEINRQEYSSYAR